MKIENAIVVVNKTRLESLIERFNTRDQARFYIEHSGDDFVDYEEEHNVFHQTLDSVVKSITKTLKVKVVDLKFVPNFLFSDKDLVIVVGQDGLVANTAKYVNNLPIVGVNPDPLRNDGVLLPFSVKTFDRAVQDVLIGKARFRKVTLAQAVSNDGQQLLAFNDLFIGPASHTSARYKLTFGNDSEEQSSSGVIVSTGAGSTGWLSSVMNMASTVSATFSESPSPVAMTLPWDTDRLAFVVREPFMSRHSGISLSAGFIDQSERLLIESHMPFNGVVFSDGIEADFIRFNSGTRVEIGVAARKALLVTDNGKR
ncbi:sugar kinase [Chryseolinea sp. T2]|uniref:sugar kinase n=1 Tax=Chryseolinea sp. T2 TaxID=3129255 RepID=UPI0030778DB6